KSSFKPLNRRGLDPAPIGDMQAHFLAARSGKDGGEDDENDRREEECEGKRTAVADNAERHDAQHGKDQCATSASRVSLTNRLSRPGSRYRISRVSMPARLRAVPNLSSEWELAPVI